ncbi:MAG: hypothetical protein ABI669_09490 [Usitatibacter sp.]
MRASAQKRLFFALLLYAAASLIHFIHNAEFLGDYPRLPSTWTRAGVYSVWLLMTLVGVAGWLLVKRGSQLPGLAVLAVYAGFGLDSLGHYILAPMSAHSAGMNSTILFEVTAAALVLVEVARQMVRRIFIERHKRVAG